METELINAPEDLRKKYADKLREVAKLIEEQPRQPNGAFIQIYFDTRDIYVTKWSDPGLSAIEVISTMERIKFDLLLDTSKQKPTIRL